jgi:heavy metal translocating P-type ATPase
LIEETIKKIKGIVEAKVCFLSDMAQVKYLPHLVSPQEILVKVSNLGYRPSVFQDEIEKNYERRNLLLRMGVSFFLSANIMMISHAVYFGFFYPLSMQEIKYLSFPLCVLTSIIIFYCGQPILKRAFTGLRTKTVTMDTLIALGVMSAYFYSILQMLKGGLHLYFDTASMLVSLVLLGKYIESRAREKVTNRITELYRLANQKVRLFTEGNEKWVLPGAVKQGQEFLVLAGERNPIDGCIVSGKANVDESILTGEPRPVNKKPGEEVMSGSMIMDGELRLKATGIGKESSLRQMIRLTQEALSKKNHSEVFADKIMRLVVPVILATSMGTAFYLLLNGAPVNVAILRAVTVLVITCPCALGIAIPLAKTALIGVARENGIVIRNPCALEQTKDLDVLVFDKTGTVTMGSFTLRDIVMSGISEAEVLSLVAPLEAHSDHFLAREIIRRSGELALTISEVKEFEEFEGSGIKGIIHGRLVAVGNRHLMKKQGITVSLALEKHATHLESKGNTIVFFAWDGKVQGFFIFGDCLKNGSTKAIKDLESRGIQTWLVSGDAHDTTRSVAKELGINKFMGQALPQNKVDVIKMLQQEGKTVGMVGDGINDAAALAQADVGLALGTGSNIAREVSDISLLSDDPYRILYLIDLSALTLKTIRQNLFFAFFYNAIGIPLAMAGVVTPIFAVLAMFASSLTVIGNTLRITRRTLPSGFTESSNCNL